MYGKVWFCIRIGVGFWNLRRKSIEYPVYSELTSVEIKTEYVFMKTLATFANL